MTETNKIPNELNSDDVTIKKTRLWIIIGAVFFFISIILALIVIKEIKASDKNKLIYSRSSENQTDLNPKKDQAASQAIIRDSSNSVRRYIDGVYVAYGEENIYPVAVMIENHVDSRPPSSLSAANLVYEAEAEGGITRFLAFFASNQDLAEIGPIRSARPYYVDWVEELNAVYAHCGGSPDALVKIKQDGVVDLNEFYNSARFWRDQKRSAPHNVYTSSEKLNEFMRSKALSQPDYKPWIFKDDEPEANRPDSQEIKISFRSFDFSVDWKYSKASNTYERYLAGQPHQDKSGEIITAKNIVIQYVNSVVLDEKARLKVENIGAGKALVCQDGVCKRGKWQKANDGLRTMFLVNNADTASSSVKNINNSLDLKKAKFNAGVTWIEVIKSSYKITY
jgi:hypothetical protein